MNPILVAKALDITTITFLGTQHNPDGSVTLGTYQPGSGSHSIQVLAHATDYTIYHEIGHAIHDRLLPRHIQFANLMQCELVADLVAILLCLFDGDLPDPDRLSFQHSEDLVSDLLSAFPVFALVLVYILNTLLWNPELFE